MLATLLVATSLGCGEGATAPPPDESPSSEPPIEAAPSGGSRLRAVYVPAYSHLPEGAERQARLSVLLSVRNVDSVATITLTHVDYFDTEGRRVRRYLRAPRRLGPLETAEFTVATQDEAGGSGANFLVYWDGPSDAHPLLTETVMWAHVGSGYVSFTSRGVELDRRPDPSAFGGAAPSQGSAGGDDGDSGDGAAATDG